MVTKEYSLVQDKLTVEIDEALSVVAKKFSPLLPHTGSEVRYCPICKHETLDNTDIIITFDQKDFDGKPVPTTSHEVDTWKALMWCQVCGYYFIMDTGR